jgi:acyl carrier protein
MTVSEPGQRILTFIRQELLDEDAQVDVDTSLFRRQLLDSMSLTSLIAFLEDEFQVRIGAMEIVYENLDTVNSMVAFIERKRSEQRS